MKAVSSSIVIAAGMAGAIGSLALSRIGPEALIAAVISLVVLGLGLAGWWAALKNER
jgi:hypothetical protein